MNKLQLHKEFIESLDEFIAQYFSPGETISTYFLKRKLKEVGKGSVVFITYLKYAKACGHRAHWTWSLTDYDRVGRHLKYCTGWFVKKIKVRNSNGSYTIRRNYLTVPSTVKATHTSTTNNYLLIG